MRVLRDECVDRRLARHLQRFTVRTVPEMGWATIKDGVLYESRDEPEPSLAELAQIVAQEWSDAGHRF